LCAGDCFWKTYQTSNQCPQCRERLTSSCRNTPEEEMCCICLTPFFPDERSQWPQRKMGHNCLHSLCGSCANTVTNYKDNKCPICNARFSNIHYP
jgi:uncharacterized CHY-type Zn-finger protein